MEYVITKWVCKCKCKQECTTKIERNCVFVLFCFVFMLSLLQAE